MDSDVLIAAFDVILIQTVHARAFADHRQVGILPMEIGIIWGGCVVTGKTVVDHVEYEFDNDGIMISWSSKNCNEKSNIVCRKGCAKAWLFLRKCDKKWKQKCDKNERKFVTSLAKKFRVGV